MEGGPIHRRAARSGNEHGGIGPGGTLAFMGSGVHESRVVRNSKGQSGCAAELDLSDAKGVASRV